MTNFTIIELLNAREPLIKIANQPVNAIVAFRLLKILKSVNDELTRFDEIRNNLWQKYGNVDPLTGQITASDEGKEIINKDLTPILTESVEFAFTKININDLGNVELTTFEMMAIEKFVE